MLLQYKEWVLSIGMFVWDALFAVILFTKYINQYIYTFSLEGGSTAGCLSYTLKCLAKEQH